MKSYENAIEDAAKHYVYMKLSKCFTKHELDVAHIVKASTIADVYERDAYDVVERQLMSAERKFESNLDWYGEYCEDASEE